MDLFLVTFWLPLGSFGMPFSFSICFFVCFSFWLFCWLVPIGLRSALAGDLRTLGPAVLGPRAVSGGGEKCQAPAGMGCGFWVPSHQFTWNLAKRVLEQSGTIFPSKGPPVRSMLIGERVPLRMENQRDITHFGGSAVFRHPHLRSTSGAEKLAHF